MHHADNQTEMTFRASKILPPEQAGFREQYSINDQDTYQSQTRDVLQKKQEVAALWINFKQAFDKVWKKIKEHEIKTEHE